MTEELNLISQLK